MKRTIRTVLAISFLGACLPAWAALMYEGRSAYDGDAQTYSAYVEGGKSRMGSADAAQYVLMDWDRKTLYMVDVASKRATDMSAGLKETLSPRKCPEPEVDAVLEHVGAGPQIAGYATEHYVVKADGKACEEIFTSRKALGDLGDWLDRARSMQTSDDNDSGRSKCEIASDKVVDLGEIGWPLKTVTLRGPGKGVEEVLRIEKNVSVPSGFFDVPAGYEVVTFEQLYPELFGAKSPGTTPQLPCPSLDEYDLDDGYDEDVYIEDDIYVDEDGIVEEDIYIEEEVEVEESEEDSEAPESA